MHPALAAHGAPQQGAGAGRRRRHGGARGAASTRASSSVTLVELDPHMTRLFADARRCCAALNGDALRSPKVHDRQRRRLQLAASRTRETLRRDRGRLPRPDQLLARQALHHELLRAARPAPGGQRLRGGADHLAAGRAQELLDRGDDDRGGRPARPRRTTRTCRASASGASSSRAAGRAALPHALPAGPALPRPPTACRRCSSSRPTWRACRPRSNRLSNQVLVHDLRAGMGQGAPVTRGAARWPRLLAGAALAAAGRLRARRAGRLRRRLGRRVASSAATALRDGARRPRAAPAVQRRAGVVIVGAGIAGLAAARALRRAGIDDFAAARARGRAPAATAAATRSPASPARSARTTCRCPATHAPEVQRAAGGARPAPHA